MLAVVIDKALEWKETTQAPYLDPTADRIVFPAEVVKGDEDQWVPLDPQLWEALEALPRAGRKVFRFDATDDLHRRNAAWLRTREGLEVVTDLEALAARLRMS